MTSEKRPRAEGNEESCHIALMGARCGVGSILAFHGERMILLPHDDDCSSTITLGIEAL